MPFAPSSAGNAQALARLAVSASFSATDHTPLIHPNGQATGLVRVCACADGMTITRTHSHARRLSEIPVRPWPLRVGARAGHVSNRSHSRPREPAMAEDIPVLPDLLPHARTRALPSRPKSHACAYCSPHPKSYARGRTCRTMPVSLPKSRTFLLRSVVFR